MRLSFLLGSLCLPLGLGCPGGDSPAASDAGLESQSVEFTVARKVLHEIFSASNCGPCFEAEERLSVIWDAFPDRFTVVDYQVGSDRYITTEAVARRFHYLPPGSESYSIPWAVADGLYSFHPNLWHAEEGTEADHYNLVDFESFASVPSFFKIDVDHRVDGQTVTIDWMITVGADVNSEDLVVHMTINEKTTRDNVGSNGLTEFHHVMKKMLPNKLGSHLGAVVAGDIIEATYTYEFKGDYDPDTGLPSPRAAPEDRKHFVDHRVAHTVEDFDDLEVVVWIQDKNTDEVHQSEWSR